jgi:hypothetical protein
MELKIEIINLKYNLTKLFINQNNFLIRSDFEVITLEKHKLQNSIKISIKI